MRITKPQAGRPVLRQGLVSWQSEGLGASWCIEAMRLERFAQKALELAQQSCKRCGKVGQRLDQTKRVPVRRIRADCGLRHIFYIRHADSSLTHCAELNARLAVSLFYDAMVQAVVRGS
jgi:hypothetical protein